LNLLEKIDAGILYQFLLHPILGIKDPKTDPRIKYIGGDKKPKKLQNIIDNGGFAIAFTLYPTSMDQVLTIADAGKVMPAKSTWFDPKLRSGLIIYLLWE